MNRNSIYIRILVPHLCSIISRCRQSRLYFLAHLASVTVRKQFLLHDNKIIRWQSARRARCFSGLLVAPSPWHGAGGPRKICEKQLLSYSPTKPLPCRGLSVTAACARLVVRDCHDLSISALTPLNPLVSASSTHIRFAPLCSTYTGMRQDLLAARLKVNHAGKWNHPFVLKEESTVNEVSSGPCVNISSPQCFHMIDLPLQGVGKSDCSLAKLPDEFQDEAEKKRERVKLWETLKGDLHPSQLVELQKRVNDKFSAFLAQGCQLSNSPLV